MHEGIYVGVGGGICIGDWVSKNHGPRFEVLKVLRKREYSILGR